MVQTSLTFHIHYMLTSQCYMPVRCYRSAYRLRPGSLKLDQLEDNKSG